jgi:transposase
MTPMISLTVEQRAELEHARKHHSKPYMREKCAAILKVADGQSCKDVAASGLLNTHAPDTISDWLKAYLEHGLQALAVHPGRGRKPAFSPCGKAKQEGKSEPQEVRERMTEMLHQDPHLFGQDCNRWTLAGIRSACRDALDTCGSLCDKSLSAVWNVLQRFHLHYKRGAGHLFSPDPHYRGKLTQVHAALKEAAERPDKVVALYADEFTLYRQPSLAQAWEQSGHQQPRAELGHRSNLVARVAGVVNAITGQVNYMLKGKIGLSQLVRFYQQVCDAYEGAERIYLLEDNWPIHFHPDVVAALQPQEWTYRPALPSSWPITPRKKAPRLNLPIQIRTLPTYAPWTNPIEKLWRLLRQTELHLHRFVDDWDGVKRQVVHFLDRYAHPSYELLTYIGLKQPLTFYRNALSLNEHASAPGSKM